MDYRLLLYFLVFGLVINNACQMRTCMRMKGTAAIYHRLASTYQPYPYSAIDCMTCWMG